MVTKSPVFLFIGSDSYLKDRALEELTSSLLDSSSKELDYKVFYGGDSDIREILDCAGTIPFLAKKKIIVIKNAEKFSKEDKERLTVYIKNPIHSTCLVLQANDESFLTENGAGEHINIRRFDSLSDHDLNLWVKNFLTSTGTGKKMSPDAVETLKELQGQDLLSLQQEIEKLIAFIGQRDEIKADDVEAVVGKSLVTSAFDLTAAIEQNRIDNAMRVIADLVLTGKKHYEIIGLLCWHLKRLMKARMARDKGEPDSRILSALRIPRRHADDFFAQLAILDIGKIRSRMQVLLEADLDLKRTKYDPALILEFAVIRMCLI